VIGACLDNGLDVHDNDHNDTAALVDEVDDEVWNETELSNSEVIQPQVQIQGDHYCQHPALNAILQLDRIDDLVVSAEQFNPIQPSSDIVQKDTLPRPIFQDKFLHFPFPSIMLPSHKLMIGDNVLVSLDISGEFSLSGAIKAGPGAEFNPGPNRRKIGPNQVEIDIVWVNPGHRSIRLLDDCSMSGVERVEHLLKRRSWIFRLTAIAFIELGEIYIPVLSNFTLYRHFQSVKSWISAL
jgi:hypothetical protein